MMRKIGFSAHLPGSGSRFSDVLQTGSQRRIWSTRTWRNESQCSQTFYAVTQRPVGTLALEPPPEKGRFVGEKRFGERWVEGVKGLSKGSSKEMKTVTRALGRRPDCIHGRGNAIAEKARSCSERISKVCWQVIRKRKLSAQGIGTELCALGR